MTDKMQEDFELLETILRGYNPSIARNDGLQTVRRLKAATEPLVKKLAEQQAILQSLHNALFSKQELVFGDVSKLFGDVGTEELTRKLAEAKVQALREAANNPVWRDAMTAGFIKCELERMAAELEEKKL